MIQYYKPPSSPLPYHLDRSFPIKRHLTQQKSK